jgi:hypothetical protein
VTPGSGADRQVAAIAALFAGEHDVTPSDAPEVVLQAVRRILGDDARSVDLPDWAGSPRSRIAALLKRAEDERALAPVGGDSSRILALQEALAITRASVLLPVEIADAEDFVRTESLRATDSLVADPVKLVAARDVDWLRLATALDAQCGAWHDLAVSSRDARDVALGRVTQLEEELRAASAANALRAPFTLDVPGLDEKQRARANGALGRELAASVHRSECAYVNVALLGPGSTEHLLAYAVHQLLRDIAVSFVREGLPLAAVVALLPPPPNPESEMVRARVHAAIERVEAAAAEEVRA